MRGSLRAPYRRTQRFYETAVGSQGFRCVFPLLSVFAFVALHRRFWSLGDSSRASIRTSRGRIDPCLLVSDVDEVGLLSKARPWKALALVAVTLTRDWIAWSKLFDLDVGG